DPMQTHRQDKLSADRHEGGRGMRRSLWQRGLVVMALGLVSSAGWASGKEPAVVSTTTDMPAPDVTTIEPAGLQEDPAPQQGRLIPRTEKGRFHEWWHNHPIIFGRYGDFNDYACGSLRSDLVFLFGSCRWFYGERCIKGPPPSPVPGFDPRTLTYDPHAPIED